MNLGAKLSDEAIRLKINKLEAPSGLPSRSLFCHFSSPGLIKSPTKANLDTLWEVGGEGLGGPEALWLLGQTTVFPA